MILRVTKFGEPILRQKGEPVTQFDSSLKELFDNMVETMHAEDGAGLAAQQVDRAVQFFVMDVGREHPDASFYRFDERQPPLSLIMPLAVANPEIEILNNEVELSSEGCLSFPGMVIEEIPREKALRMKFQDLDGAHHVFEAEGFLARVILHEFDHLQGALFIDRARPKEIKRHTAELEALEAATQAYLAARENT